MGELPEDDILRLSREDVQDIVVVATAANFPELLTLQEKLAAAHIPAVTNQPFEYWKIGAGHVEILVPRVLRDKALRIIAESRGQTYLVEPVPVTPRRGLFQLHLSTMVIATIAAGAMLMGNLVPGSSGSQGWPLMMSWKYQGRQMMDTNTLALNVILDLAILGAVFVSAEFLVRQVGRPSVPSQQPAPPPSPPPPA